MDCDDGEREDEGPVVSDKEGRSEEAMYPV